MNSFLITYKPETENPERGWPLEELQKLVRKNQAGERAIEPWRFRNLKGITLGDRVFLLLQGRGGPAIIGYGEIAGQPERGSGTWYVPIQFESIVNPTVEVLANRSAVHAIVGGERFWRIQSSGVRLTESVASELEALVVGASPEARHDASVSNPDWVRDELILALNFYLHHRPSPPRKNSEQIHELSESIKKLGERLHSGADPSNTFRNESGVYMKLMNFRSLDPAYTADGKTGLVRGAKADKEVWDAFAEDPERCRQAAEAIMASLDDPDTQQALVRPDLDDGVHEAPEGRLLTRLHIARERNRQLVENKRRQALAKFGTLECEACGFDFAAHYGERGKGFIECHHLNPVATLVEGHKTHLDDLALLCANCHRMVHRDKQWLSLPELKALISAVRSSYRQNRN
jgi:5-methylcytosine-specific restriction protein A